MRYAFFLLFFILVDSAWGQVTGPSDIMGNADMILSGQQISLYSEQALGGDRDAANHLGQYFLAIKNDRIRAEKWYLISAENGDEGAQRTYANLILQDSKENKTRAIFWLKKASQGGNSSATADLEKLQH
jgi:TPR repeat protein